MTRRLLGLLTIVLTAIVGVVAVPAVAPAGAVTRTFTVTVPEGQGVLQIRDAENPQELGTPTSVSGTVDDETGVISGATLSTPAVEFDTVALGLPVKVKATFTQVAPGTGSGLVTPTPPAATGGEGQKGQVTLRDTVKVDLNLKIGNPLILEANCSSSPVSLEFISTTPYTEAGGGTVQDADFTVPPVQTTPSCITQVADGVNNLLAGGGHSLTMFIQGDLPVPPIKPATETTLSVDPSEGSLRGAPVTLTAEVTEVEPNDLDPTGTVVFREGTRILGTGDLQPDGTATLTTTALRAGDRSLTAEYQGDVEFGPSTSDPVIYSVAPAPILTGTFPEYITRGAAPVEFDLNIDNIGSSRPVSDARVDIVVPGLNGGNLVLERQLPDTTWVNVPLPHSFTAQGLAGTLGPPEGAEIPANAVQTYHLRVSAANIAPVRPAQINFNLVTVDGTEDPPTVATSSWPFNIVLAARVPTTTFVNVYDVNIRPGQTLYVDTMVMAGGDVANTGEVEFLIDGRVVPFRSPSPFGPLAPKQTRGTISGGYTFGEIDVPTDLTTGPHLVSVRYLGDASYLPSSTILGSLENPPYVLQVLDPLGPLYTCDYVTVSASQVGAYLQAFVRLPAYAEDGDELNLEDVDVTLIPGGLTTTGLLPQLATAPGFGVDQIEIDLGDAGTLEGDGLVYEPDDDTADQFLYLQNVAGTVIVDGEPGEVMALPIERIAMTGFDTIGARFTFTCLPQAEPVILDEVGVAGVSLTAETSTDPVRTGDPVVLTATAAPAHASGLIEFYSGSQSLGTASGAAGTATITVDDLSPGTNLITARYSGVAGSPYQSNIIEIQVRPATECPTFNDAGNGRAVRLVYLELLQRCPDQAGYDYWKGKLDGGYSREAFAREISRSLEARKVFVDKAYRLILGRPADSGGKAFWAPRLATGRFDRLIADLGSLSEFWTQAGSTNEGFVRLVYERILKRQASASDVAYWAGRLQAGESRRALLLTLFNLPEPLSVVVRDAYQEILCRAPNATESAAGVTLMRASSNLSHVYGRLIGTQEFYDRAQASPNPEDC